MSQEMSCEIERLEKDFLWPENKRLAINFNIAFEMWTPDSCSSVNPMGNVLAGDMVDPNADSYGRYNANVGAKGCLILRRVTAWPPVYLPPGWLQSTVRMSSKTL